MKRPSFQFYPGDWLEDIGLRASCLAARGLWADMLCFMHQGEPFGHLRKNGRDIAPDELARMVGAAPARVGRLLRELEEHHVFSRTEAGTIYSRRQVRDEALREKRAGYGQLSQNHPDVPKKKPKDGSKDRSKDTFQGSVGGSPSSPSPSPSPSPTETAAIGGRADDRGPAPPPPACGVLDHDPTNPTEAALAQHIDHLARLTGDPPLEILASVSHTPQGKELDGIRGRPAKWLETTLSACSAFEADLGARGAEP